MRIARQIRKHSFWSCERPLRIYDPFACAQRREPPREGSGIGKCGVITEEPQLALAIRVGELFQETAPEQPREHAYWQEEAGPACDPPLTITREASTGNDAVHVRMVCERRTPRMQYQGRANLRAQMLWIGSDRAQGFGGDVEEQPVDDRLVIQAIALIAAGSVKTTW